MAADVTDVLLDVSDFAETLTRLTDGDESRAATFVAIVTWEADATADSRGRGAQRQAVLTIAADTRLQIGDAVMIGGERYEVKTAGTPQYGMKHVTVFRYTPEAKGVRKAGDI